MTAVNQQSVPTPDAGFFVAAFSAFGHFEGIGWWEYQKLSAKWIDLCQQVLDQFGDFFDYTWSGNLSHIRTRLTSVSGSGICTIFVNNQTASSILLMSGKNADTDTDVSRMYIDSIRAPLLSRIVGMSEEVFSELETISDRPLMVVVPFPSEMVSEQDQDIVRELGWHLAAAFLQVQT